ncbi:MAG: potassium channel protein [Deltaproteobacteria bacterium]|nr:potassium channel protein [Deltaproteobacteria bacterium]
MDHTKLKVSVLLFFSVISLGTTGYMLLENMHLFEALYMTIITISTVGFSEVKPLSPAGRTVTIFIIITGISMGTYTLGQIFKVFIEGELRIIMGRRKLEKNISRLKDHWIICGYGRIGTIISRELSTDKMKFVVIERDSGKVEELEQLKYLFLNMDATTEEALLAAGIMDAKGIVTAVRSDAHNVFITLTAKGLRSDIFVLSRASDVKNEGKLLKAGATRVVSPYVIGGRRMAQVLRQPTVVDFIDTAMMNGELALSMEEAMVNATSSLIDKTLMESNIRQDFGVIIIAIKKPTGDMIFNPMPTEKLEAGDVVVVIGKKVELERLADVLN